MLDANKDAYDAKEFFFFSFRVDDFFCYVSCCSSLLFRVSIPDHKQR